jgi:uncharacterized membrane protein
MTLQRLWESARDSLWFVPSLFVVGSAGFAFAVLAVDRASVGTSAVPLVFGGGAEGARGVLSSIAASMITVAGVTFSITVVALQLASSQFSPRVLRTFMRDRASQLVLGTFIGAFTYSLLVLRAVRGENGDGGSFVPAIGVSVGILYALVALGALVYFIHHIATRIQVSTITATVVAETLDEIRRTWPERVADAEDVPRVPDGPAAVVEGRESGYVQLVDAEGLIRLATERDLVVQLAARPGAWVLERAPIGSVWPASVMTADLGDEIAARLTVGRERTMSQDAPYGIRQLVDIAVKAISPGINDPTTATDCVHRIGEILVTAAWRQPPQPDAYDGDGRLRLVTPRFSWEELVDLAFDELRQYGGSSANIAIALSDTLEELARGVPADRRHALAQKARQAAAAAAAIPIAEDRRRDLAALDRSVAAST